MGLFKRKPVEVAGLVFDHQLTPRDVDALDRLSWDESQRGDLSMRITEVIGPFITTSSDQALRTYAVVALLHTESGEAIDSFRDQVFDLAVQAREGTDNGFSDVAGGEQVVEVVAPALIEWLIARDSIEPNDDFRDRAVMLAGTVSNRWTVGPDLLRQLAARFPDRMSLHQARVNETGRRLIEPLIT